MKHTVHKVNERSILEAVYMAGRRFNNAEVEQRHNCVYVHTHRTSLSTDEVISVSIRLYGNHNSLEIQKSFDADEGLVLLGGAYDVLPEFVVPGEMIEFELPDREKES